MTPTLASAKRTEGDHYQVSENVFANLPAWEQKLWSEVREDFLGDYSKYPDLLAPTNSHEVCACVDPDYKDFVYIDGVFSQVALEAGEWRMAPLVRYCGTGGGDHILSREPFQKVMGHYLERIVQSLRGNDHVAAAKYAGVVSHLMCDRHPGDHIDPAVWNGLLFPPPNSEGNTIWGLTTQEVDIARVHHEPKLLGLSVREAMHGFYQGYLRVMKLGIPYVSRMLVAAYEGNPAKAQALLSDVRLLGIALTSDFLHTAFCLAYERFPPSEVSALEECDLSSVFPIQNEMDYLYFGGPYPDGVIDFFPAGSEGFKPRKIPARLLVPDASNKTKIETFPFCLGVLPDSGCQLTERWAKLVFDLSGSDFRRFTCTAGLSADLGVKNRVRGNVSFQVLGDESVLFERKEMRGGEAAVSLDLDLRVRKKLTLLVRGEHRIQEEFWLGHFIWGNPRISKK